MWCKATYDQLTVINPGIGPLNCLALHDSKIYLAVSNHRGHIVMFDIEDGQLIQSYQTNNFEAIACLAFCVGVAWQRPLVGTSSSHNPTR